MAKTPQTPTLEELKERQAARAEAFKGFVGARKSKLARDLSTGTQKIEAPTVTAPSVSTTGEPSQLSGTTAPSLPKLTPSFRFVSEPVKQELRAAMASGLSEERPEERERIIQMALNFNNQARFAQKVIDKQTKGELSEGAQHRLEQAMKILEQTKKVIPMTRDMTYQDLATAYDAGKALSIGVGPNKELRIDLTRNLKTGALALDVPSSLRKVYGRYLKEYAAEEGISLTRSTSEELKDVAQRARDQAARDIISVGMSARLLSTYDPTPANVEEIAKSPFRGIRAFTTQQKRHGSGTFGIFNPTAEELQKEGFLDRILKTGPADYFAVKAKLIRDKLSENGEPLGISDFALYAYTGFNPIVADIALQQLGVTPEEEVEAFLQGHSMLDEGRAFQGEMAAIASDAFGGDVEDQKAARKAATESNISLAMPMVAYLFEPDLITASLFGVGKGIKVTKAFRHASRTTKAASILEKGAQDSSMDLVKLIDEVKRADDTIGRHAEISIVATSGRVLGDIEETAKQLVPRQDAVDAARITLQTKLPTVDIDDLVSMSQAARANPDLIKDAKTIVEESARLLGATQAMAIDLDKRLNQMGKIIKEQREAKAAALSLDGKLKKASNELAVRMAKSPNLQKVVNAQAIVTRIKAQQKAALKAGDKNLIIQTDAKLKKAEPELRRLKKALTAEEGAFLAKFRKETKTNSRLWRKHSSIFQGDTALKDLTALDKKARTTSLRLGVRVQQAQSGLTAASRRLTVMDPSTARKFRKSLKEKGLRREILGVVKAAQKTVGDFSRKQQALNKSLEAAKWREEALTLAGRYRAAAKEMRKVSFSKGTILSKTGILGARTSEAIEMLSDAVSIESKAFDPAAFSVRETAAKNKRIVTIQSQDQKGIVLAGTVSAKAPDMLRANALKTPKGLESAPEAMNTLRSLVEYAQRNNLGLDLSAKGLEDAADTLRAAAVPLDSSGKIGAKTLRGLDIAEFQGKLNQQASTFILDGRGLKAKLEAGFGAPAVAHILTKMGEDGKTLAKALESETPIRVTAAQAERIQIDMGNVLARRSQLLDPENQAEVLATILHDARTHWNTSRKGTLKWFESGVKGFFRSFDPWLRRLGTSAEEVQQIVRGGDNYVEMAWDEYSQTIRRAGPGADSVSTATFRYIDTTTRQLLSGNKTSIINIGAKTIFQKAKRSLLTDTDRLKYQHAEKLEEAASQNNPALLGLSRMWLRSGEVVTADKAALLYGLAIKNLRNASSAQEFTALHKKSTAAVVDSRKVDSRTGRVLAFMSRAMIVGSAYDEIGHIAKKASGGLVSADEMHDINRILNIGPRKEADLAKIVDVDAAFKNLHAMGISFLEPEAALRKAGTSFWTQAIEEQKKIVKIGEDISGESVFALNIARRNLDSALSGYIKSLQAVQAQELNLPMRALRGFWQKYMQLWRTDAVTGFLVPNMGKVVFDRVGDSAQMWLSSGLGFASRATFQNVWTDIPKLGPILQDRMSKAAREGNPVLRTILETTINPHIDDFWQGRQGAMRIGKNGPLVSYDYLRKQAVLKGITDARASVEVIDIAQDLVKNDPLIKKLITPETSLSTIFRPLGKWQDGIERFIQNVQQRQRVGTWLLHISDGKSIDEATRITRESLYDWRHGMAQGELLHILRQFPFARWMKLTGAQIAAKSTDFLTKPTMGVLTDAARGNTALNRLRVMYRGQRDVIPQLMDSRSLEQIAEEEGYMNAVARALYPKWMKTTYPLAYIMNVDRGDMDRNAEMYGDRFKATHWAGILPPNSIVDYANMSMAVPHMAMSSYLYLTGEGEAATDLFYKSAEPIVGMLYPAQRDIVETMLGMGYGGGIDPTRPQKINPMEATLLRTVGVEVAQGEDGGWNTNALAGTVLRSIPPMAISIPRLVNAAYYRNPAAGEDTAEMAKYFALNATRVLRTYPYNVYKEHERLQKAMSRRASGQEKRAGLEKKE